MVVVIGRGAGSLGPKVPSSCVSGLGRVLGVGDAGGGGLQSSGRFQADLLV